MKRGDKPKIYHTHLGIENFLRSVTAPLQARSDSAGIHRRGHTRTSLVAVSATSGTGGPRRPESEAITTAFARDRTAHLVMSISEPRSERAGRMAPGDAKGGSGAHGGGGERLNGRLLLAACWSVCRKEDQRLEPASRKKRRKPDEKHEFEPQVGRVYRLALAEFEQMQVRCMVDVSSSAAIARLRCAAAQRCLSICTCHLLPLRPAMTPARECAAQRKVQRTMIARDMLDEAQRVESRCIARLHPLPSRQQFRERPCSPARSCQARPIPSLPHTTARHSTTASTTAWLWPEEQSRTGCGHSGVEDQSQLEHGRLWRCRSSCPRLLALSASPRQPPVRSPFALPPRTLVPPSHPSFLPASPPPSLPLAAVSFPSGQVSPIRLREHSN